MCAKLDTTGLLADVTYAILFGDREAGHERAYLYRRAEGGYWMTSALDLTWPFPRALYVEVNAGPDWHVESLNVRLSGSAHRDATYRMEGSGAWRATIQTDEATVERQVPVGPKILEFNSVWLSTLALNRLRLAPGQARDVDVVWIEMPSLEPVPTQRRYECMGPDQVTTPAGKQDALHYVVSGSHHMWANLRGIIMAGQYTENDLRYDVRLLKYRWLG
jgi:hypothetical protein